VSVCIFKWPDREKEEWGYTLLLKLSITDNNPDVFFPLDVRKLLKVFHIS